MSTETKKTTPQARRLCRRVARAIFELDNASWHATSEGQQADRNTIEDCRRLLYSIMSHHGYEFAQTDSPRIRRAKP